VAEWLEEKMGIVVPKPGHKRAESIPFSQQPSKKNAEPKSSAPERHSGTAFAYHQQGSAHLRTADHYYSESNPLPNEIH
jgi:hypothetical protein